MTDVPAESKAPDDSPAGVNGPAPMNGKPAPADDKPAMGGQNPEKDQTPAHGLTAVSGPAQEPAPGLAMDGPALVGIMGPDDPAPGDGSAPFNPPSGEIRLNGGDLVAVAPPPPPEAQPAEPTPPPPTGGQQAKARVKGRIDIADEVIEKVAAAAAYEVDGVADLGGDINNALEMIRQRIGIGRKKDDRVTADIAGGEADIDVAITIKYGYSIIEVARRVQVNVAHQAHLMLGLKVAAVNVTVEDIELPEDALTYKEEDEDSRSGSGFSIET